MLKPLETFVISYDDSSFTNPHTTITAGPANDPTGKFTHMGAFYEGWEDKRGTGVEINAQGWQYDYNAIRHMEIGLKQRAIIEHVDISTKWFTGNNVPEISIECLDISQDNKYRMVIDRRALKPDSDHRIQIPGAHHATHVRILAHQEGGIARINIHGSQAEIQPIKPPNLLSSAFLISASNAHYGSPVDAVGGMRKENFMKGWESARTGRGEFALFKLKKPSTIQGLVVDTYLHRLNPIRAITAFGITASQMGNEQDLLNDAPKYKIIFADGHEEKPDDLKEFMESQDFKERAARQGMGNMHIERYIPAGSRWKEILPQTETFADQFHYFGANHIRDLGTEYTHILFQHGPNGGLHGLKAYGGMTKDEYTDVLATPENN